MTDKYYEVIIDKLGDKKEELGEEYNKIVEEVEGLKKDNKLEDELEKVIEEILDGETKKEGEEPKAEEGNYKEKA